MSISDDPGPVVSDTGVSAPPAEGGGLTDRLVDDIGADGGDRDTVEPGISHETDADRGAID